MCIQYVLLAEPYALDAWNAKPPKFPRHEFWVLIGLNAYANHDRTFNINPDPDPGFSDKKISEETCQIFVKLVKG